MRWTNSGFTPESAPRTAAGWEVFFPARLLFWDVRSHPPARTVSDSCSEGRARDPSPSGAFSSGCERRRGGGGSQVLDGEQLERQVSSGDT